jgi:hypothetical protein
MAGEPTYQHRPVMVDEITDLFAPVPAGVVIDATLGGGGHIETAGEMQADVVAGDALNLFVKRNGIGLQPRNRRVAVERVKASGRMPARPCRELLAFAQDHVGPAHFGEVVKDTAADDSAPDNGDIVN